MIAVLRLGCGVLLLICANIALGSVRAAISREWDWTVFRSGLIKGGIVVFAFAAVYAAGWLNPDLVVVELEDQTVNLQMAVYLVLLAGFTFYAAQVLGKLKGIITAKKQTAQKTDGGA